MRPSLILFLLLSLLTLTSNAQDTGNITYEDKIDLHRNIPADKAELKDMMPQYNSSQWELTFTPNESVYQRFVEKELTGTSANQSYSMRFGRENRIVYKNLEEDKIIDSRDFMQKQFLIKGFASSRKWKIGKSSKVIAGYNCMDASCKVDSTTSVTAWFAPKINISNGPADYQSLPGMILQIDINNGERTITATEVNMKDADPSPIVIPTKGKEVTAEEFQAIRDEKMKEMNLHQKPGGPVMITRHN